MLNILGLEHTADKSITATEGWEPNVPVVRYALDPWGIEVVKCHYEQDTQKPFAGSRFVLVSLR